MENINYQNEHSHKTNLGQQLTVPDKLDDVSLFSVKKAFQAMIIQKTMECHELLSNYLYLSHPLARMSLAFVLINPYQSWSLLKTNMPIIYRFGGFIKQSTYAFFTQRKQPIKKTFTIYSINENAINHLYVAFDWYLKHKSKIKKEENKKIISMIKPINASKENKTYPILETVPESKETEFTYNGYVFYYTKLSKDDMLYAPSGAVEKKNYYIEIWSYYANDDIITNLNNHVINEYAKSKVDEVWRPTLFENTGETWRVTPITKHNRTLKSVVLKNRENERISNSLFEFSSTEDWHTERGIPYKKSFLFYGHPGTGKSSAIKAISNEMKRHIHFLNFSMIKNDQEFSKLMGQIKLPETVLVLEDLDCQTDVVMKRKKENETETESTSIKVQEDVNTEKKLEEVEKKLEELKPKLTLSAILNHIDGVYDNHGMVLVITTNHPDKLDPALLRSGRVDERIYFGHCDNEMIFRMFENFYRDMCPSKNEIYEIDVSTENITPCDVENAMRRHYKKPLDAIKMIKNREISKLETF